MEDFTEEITSLASEFQACQPALLALGDENRQHLLLELMQMGKPQGARVGEIAARTHLSRPAVSHHLQILKNAGILRVRHEGTKNYYSFASDAAAFDRLLRMLRHAKRLLTELPCGSCGREPDDPSV